MAREYNYINYPSCLSASGRRYRSLLISESKFPRCSSVGEYQRSPGFRDPDPLADLYHHLAGPVSQDPKPYSCCGRALFRGIPHFTPFKGEPFLIGSHINAESPFQRDPHSYRALGLGPCYLTSLKLLHRVKVTALQREISYLSQIKNFNFKYL